MKDFADMFNYHFNSIKVRLEPDASTAEKIYEVNFNSIKVRLEPISGVNVPTTPVFQFHKGAIRTAPPRSLDQKAVLFQFHKGAIRTR